MKVSTLKRLILEVLKEYELSPEDKEAMEKKGITGEEHWWLRRQVGLQTSDEYQQDRANLQEYHEKLKSTPEGRRMIQAFRQANGVTIAHGLGYISYAESSLGGSGDANRKSISKWINSYASLNNNQLSTVAWIGSPSNIPSGYTGFSNHEAITGGSGLLLKGYPVLVSGRSVSSQTLSSLPQGLIKHQASSGIAKRGDMETPIYSLEEMAEGIGRSDANWSGETLLDNWEIVGCFVTLDLARAAKQANSLENLIDDVESTGLTCHIFSDTGHVGTLEDLKRKRGN